MQCPLIPAMKSLSIRSIAVIASSHLTRSESVSSPAASALRSTPVWNARPSPVMTTTRTPLRAATVATTSPSSAAKRALPAFSTSGRSNVMRAIGPRTSRRIVASWAMGHWLYHKSPRDVPDRSALPDHLLQYLLEGRLSRRRPRHGEQRGPGRLAARPRGRGLRVLPHGRGHSPRPLPDPQPATCVVARASCFGDRRLCLTSGGGVPGLVLGRLLMGPGPAPSLMGGLTASLRFPSRERLAPAPHPHQPPA